MHGLWKTKERRDQFWAELDVFLNQYPELFDGMDEAYESFHHDSDCDCVYDPKSPKFLAGKALILHCKNLDNFESSIVLDPREQSRFHTIGLLKNGLDLL